MGQRARGIDAKVPRLHVGRMQAGAAPPNPIRAQNFVKQRVLRGGNSRFRGAKSALGEATRGVGPTGKALRPARIGLKTGATEFLASSPTCRAMLEGARSDWGRWAGGLSRERLIERAVKYPIAGPLQRP